MSAPRRRELIQAIQDIIVRACPVAESFAYEAIANWSAGEEPATPVEAAVFQVVDEFVARMDGEAEDPDRCSNPGGHEWNRTLGEADEARLSGDHANDSIRCVHCGADGDS